MAGAMTAQILREVDGAPEQKDARRVASLLSISKSTRALVRLKLSELGFHNGQDESLFVLNEHSEMPASTIADEFCARPTAISKIPDRPIATGMAERMSDGRGARRTMVGIAPKGLDARGHLRAMRERPEAELTFVIPDDLEATPEASDSMAANPRNRLR